MASTPVHVIKALQADARIHKITLPIREPDHAISVIPMLMMICGSLEKSAEALFARLVTRHELHPKFYRFSYLSSSVEVLLPHEVVKMIKLMNDHYSYPLVSKYKDLCEGISHEPPAPGDEKKDIESPAASDTGLEV
jgi:hypothetical protein